MKILRFLLSSVIGFGFFLIPIPIQGRATILFDLFVKKILQLFPMATGYYCLLLILFGAVATALSYKKKNPFFAHFKSSLPFSVLRFVGLLLAILFLFQKGPLWLLDPKISHLMWKVLTYSVAVIIPFGAVILNLFVSYGCLEFIGTLMRPLMRPLFKLPGRSALDNLTSWIGSYSIGLYTTRRIFDMGCYNRKEAYTIATCFSTVSIGFVGVITSTLDILHLFPLIFGIYFFTIYFLAIILVRIWPINRIPETYVAKPNPEPDFKGSPKDYLQLAWQSALQRAGSSPGFLTTAKVGFLDGLRLVTTILGTILAVGTLAILVAEYTPLFTYLGAPLVPILKGLGLPDAAKAAPAAIAGITEMYIPALLVKDAAVPTKFFIAVLSISQLIFFSGVGPMMIDMFHDIPIRFWELIVLFLIRTAILVPILAGITFILGQLGFF